MSPTVQPPLKTNPDDLAPASELDSTPDLREEAGLEGHLRPVIEAHARPDWEEGTASTVFEKIPTPKKPSRQARAPKPFLQKFENFLIPALILFILGNALAFSLPQLPLNNWMVSVPFVLMLLGVGIYGVQKTEKNWILRVAIWAILFIVGCLYYPQHTTQSLPATDISHLVPLQRADVQGILLQRPSNHRVSIQVQKVNGKVATGVLQTYLPYDYNDSDLSAGTRMWVTGDLEKPFKSVIPGSFNQESYLASQGITAVLKRPERVMGFQTVGGWTYSLQRITDDLKTQISTAFHKTLPSPQSEILGGLVLGDKAIPVDPNTKHAFVQSGLVHLLAASGMNVGIIAATIFWLLGLLKIPYRKRIGVAIVAVAIYSLMTGLPPSIQRAATMLELALILKLLNRKLSPVFLLCLATAALVVWHPENIGNVGFQFSVLTTFGLLAMLPPLQEGIGYYTTRWLAGLVLVPAIAQLWIWPLSIAYFNQFPIHSIPLNILSLVLITPLTILGFAAALLSLISPALASWLTLPAKPLLDGLLTLAQWGGQQSWAQWALPSPSPCLVMALYGLFFVGLGLLYCFNDMPAKRKALLGLIPLTLLLGGCVLEKVQNYKQARIELLPLSTSQEAYLIKPAVSDDYLAILPEQIGYRESRTLADFFRHRNITHLRAALLLPDSTNETTTQPTIRTRRRPEADQTVETSPKTYLNTAFKALRMDMLLTALPPARVANLDYQDAQPLPQPGIKLSLGSSSLEGHYKALRLLSGPYCLLAIDQPDTDNSLDGQQAIPGCGLRIVTHDQPSLFAQGAIPANRYYQLIQDDSQLSVYSNP